MDDTGTITYHGSCSDYCRETYCHHAAIFQYSERLRSKAKLVPQNRKRLGFSSDRDRYRNPISVLKTKYLLIAEKMDSIRSEIMKYMGKNNCPSIEISGLVDTLSKMPNVIERWNHVKRRSTTNKILRLTQIANRCIVKVLDIYRFIAKLEEYSTTNHDDIIKQLISLCPVLLQSINLL